jgi:hypothetical protein
MRRTRWTVYLWPGLPQLWRRGSWSGLAVAVAAAGLLNLALLGSFGWSELITPGWLGTLWLMLAVVWVGSSVLSLVDNRRQRSQEQARSAGDGFREAQEHYLRGNWFQAERLLGELLCRRGDDPDARLMLAALLRHTGRLDEASAQLDLLARSEGAGKWEWEVRRERELLSQVRERNDDQDGEQPGRSPTDPPTGITNAA